MKRITPFLILSFFSSALLARQGSQGKPIVVDKYGGDKLPLIRGDGEEHPYVVYLDNVRYWEVNNLEITDAGEDSADVKSGVYIFGKNAGTLRYIHLKKLFIHDITGFCDHDTGYGDAGNWDYWGNKVPENSSPTIGSFEYTNPIK